MTCEVAVMNKRGVALAADSAVTMGNGKKIYNTAEKLFRLSTDLPVAIMTYGAAEIMGVPWETIITIYACKLGKVRFDALDDYAQDFFKFIEGSSYLFPTDRDEERVCDLVEDIWRNFYADRLKKEMVDSDNNADLSAKLATMIREDHTYWERYSDIENHGMAFGEKIVVQHYDALKRVAINVFEGLDLSDDVVTKLCRTAAFMFGKNGPMPNATGVVVAGFGDSEPFPRLFECRVGPILAGRLRVTQKSTALVDHDCEAIIVPFAQREIIDLIIDGVHPELAEKIADEVDKGEPSTEDKSENERQKLGDFIRTESKRMHGRPFMRAVSALPRQDLGKLAETLVDLTAFMLRMSAESQETVGGPVDVAILSKADGFTWVKHKEINGR